MPLRVRLPPLVRVPLPVALALALVAGAPALSGCTRDGQAPGAAKTKIAGDADAPAKATPADAKAQPDRSTGPDDGGAGKHQDNGLGLAIGTQGAVTSAEAHASDIGLDVLRRGGNAVDAAVAVGFALGVTHPSAGNIGGGGFMVLRLADGAAQSVDYREMAPGAASPDMYLDAQGEVTEDSRMGPRAAGIPGVVAGFAHAHKRWGTRPWAELVEPAVALARDGWTLDSFHADDLRWGSERMQKYLDALKERQAAEASTLGKPQAQRLNRLIAAVEATLKTFRHEDGSDYKEGETWRQPALAATLEQIAKGGPDAFYEGPLAKTMADEVHGMGGLWTTEDLAGYTPVDRAPIEFDYHGHHIITMPPPSAGGVVLRQILAASEVLELGKLDWDSVERMHLYVEALRRTYADRNLLLGDPDFVELPMEKLLDVSYMKDRMADVDHETATPSAKVGSGVELVEKRQTTHFSVVDKHGMAVSNTYTLNGGFGAKVQIPDTGVTLNNEMDDFTAKPGTPNMFGLVQGPQNAIAPKKRMLSSMTPTIVEQGGKLRAVVGSPGGPTITTTVAQIIMQLIDHDRPIEAAVAATRLHHQWLPDKITYEENLDAATVEALKARGHDVRTWGRIGHANCIGVDPETGELRAVADVTRDGGKASAF